MDLGSKRPMDTETTGQTRQEGVEAAAQSWTVSLETHVWHSRNTVAFSARRFLSLKIWTWI